MTRAFTLTGARITHDIATVSALEKAAYDDDEARLAELIARDGVEEAFLLQTCNRVEEYVVTKIPATGEEALADAGGEADDDCIVLTGHEASLDHLLRVAAGLESQVLGEDQILGQVRSAYLAAKEIGTIGPVLEAALLKAIHVGERARNETSINEGTVSLGSAAVELVEREHGLDGQTVLLVGAGETATVVASCLADANLGELRMVNRTEDRVVALAFELGIPARVGGLDTLEAHLRKADVVITATASPDPLIGHELADAARGTLIVDLGQPRDVSPEIAGRAGIRVFDLDALEAVTAATHEDRREATANVEEIVEAEYGLLIDQYKRRRADAVIQGMYQGAERIKHRELRTALRKLETDEGITPDQRAVVEDLADALVAKLLAVPTKSLREAAAEDDWETVASAIQLFDPTLLDEAPPAELLALASSGEASADAGDD